MSDKTFKWDIEQWKNYTLADSNFNKLDWIDGVIDRSHDNLSNQNGPEFCRYNNNNVVIAVYAVYPDILEKGIFKKDGILQVLEIEDTTTLTDIADGNACLKICMEKTYTDATKVKNIEADIVSKQKIWVILKKRQSRKTQQ